MAGNSENNGDYLLGEQLWRLSTQGYKAETAVSSKQMSARIKQALAEDPGITEVRFEQIPGTPDYLVLTSRAEELASTQAGYKVEGAVQLDAPKPAIDSCMDHYETDFSQPPASLRVQRNGSNGTGVLSARLVSSLAMPGLSTLMNVDVEGPSQSLSVEVFDTIPLPSVIPGGQYLG